MTRITLDGDYLSPNICFIGPNDPEDDHDDHATASDEADEGASESDADESDGDGDEADAEGSEGDDAEADDGEENSGDVEPAAEAPKRRTANDVIREQKRSRKESDRRAAEAERKADEAERKAAEALRRADEAERRVNERRAQESQAEEAQRLELMTESERIAHYRARDKEEHQREMNGVKFQIWDSTDRAEFRQLVREHPLVAKVKDQVESEFAKLNSQGRPVSREILAELFIGRMTRASYGKTSAAAKQRGEERVRRETVKPTRTRSDVTPERRRQSREDTPEARRRRLEDVQL